MQSHDYVPGVSGWKLNKNTGEFEINAAKITVGALPERPQLVAVTAGSWSESELPANAIERYSFIRAELLKIPDEFREGAELSVRDESYDPDFTDIRTALTYTRRETAEEVEARQKKVRSAGTTVENVDGLITISQDGVPRVRFGNLSAATPSVVAGDQVFISQSAVDDGTIKNAKVENIWSVKMQLTADGRYRAAGIGLGYDSPFLVSADRFAIKDQPHPGDSGEALPDGGMTSILEMLAGKIGETELGADLKAALPRDFSDRVRDVLREEIKPGGILHRK